MNDLFDVLAEPLRREILVHLRKAAPGDLAVGDLVGLIGSTQPTASKHLKVLREAGLVSVREEGQHRFYRVNAGPLAAIESWVSSVSDGARTAPASPRTTATARTDAAESGLRKPGDPVVRILPEVDVAEVGRAVGWIAADLAARAAALLRPSRPSKSR